MFFLGFIRLLVFLNPVGICFVHIIFISLLIFACDNSKGTNQQNSDQQGNDIQWTNADPLHDEMIRSAIGHFLNIEREKAYVFFEKAVKLDSTSFAAHVMMSTMSLPNSEKQELHYKLAKRYSADKNENSKRFVSLLDIKTENGYSSKIEKLPKKKELAYISH